MRHLLTITAACIVHVTAPAHSMAGEHSPAAEASDEETTVEEEVSFEEEVTFEEEVDRADFISLAPLPEYQFNRWLQLLPVLCFAVLLLNVAWRPKQKKASR